MTRLEGNDLKEFLNNSILPKIKELCRRKEIRTWFNEGELIRSRMPVEIKALLGPSEGGDARQLDILLGELINDIYNIYLKELTYEELSRLDQANLEVNPEPNCNTDSLISDTTVFADRNIKVSSSQNVNLYEYRFLLQYLDQWMKIFPMEEYMRRGGRYYLVNVIKSDYLLPIKLDGEDGFSNIDSFDSKIQNKIVNKFTRAFVHTREMGGRLELYYDFSQRLADIYLRNINQFSRVGELLVSKRTDIHKDYKTIEDRDYQLTLYNWYGIVLVATAFYKQLPMQIRSLFTALQAINFRLNLQYYLLNDFIRISPVQINKRQICGDLVSLTKELQCMQDYYYSDYYESFLLQSLDVYIALKEGRLMKKK